MAAYVRAQLRQLQNPILLSELEKMVAARFGPLVHDDWLGYERFRLMLAVLVPEANITGRAIFRSEMAGTATSATQNWSCRGNYGWS